jgi:hypothetical protein
VDAAEREELPELTQTSEVSAAFNAGSDARLAGLPLTANPHPEADLLAHDYWAAGWRHVERFWGCDASRRQAVVPLPPVRDDG